MAVEPITGAGATGLVMRGLGVESASFHDRETVAALLRHAASHRCPVTSRELLSDVIASAEWLASEDDVTRERLGEVLRLLVTSGDLIEGNVTDETGTRRTLFLGPPTFVAVSNGVLFLLGVRPDGLPLLSDGLTERVQQRGALRFIQTTAGDELEAELVEQGVRALSVNAWVAAPRVESPAELVKRYSGRLERVSVGGLDGFRVIDPSRPQTFYNGRWRELQPGDRGFLVGRREQAFGADLWCCLDVSDDLYGRFLDLPALDLELSGADEAWRLQSAIDFERGTPEFMRIATTDSPGATSLVFYAPLPSWGQRRLDAVGTPEPPTAGGLLAYAVPQESVEAEAAFLAETLWIQTRSQ